MVISYLVGTILHDNFSRDEYSGYIGTQILSFYVGGGEVLQTVKTSERFTQLTKSVLAKMNEIKALLRSSKALRITEKVGTFLLDDAASVGLDAPADVLAMLKTAANQAKSLKRIQTLLNTKYTGAWSPGTYGDAAKNFKLGHYDKHVVEKLEWDEIISPDAYRQKAIDLLKRRDTGVEIYYQPGKKNMVVYDRATNELAIGNEVVIDKISYGEIQTLFRPNPVKKNGIEINYMDNLVSEGSAIRIKG